MSAGGTCVHDEVTTGSGSESPTTTTTTPDVDDDEDEDTPAVHHHHDDDEDDDLHDIIVRSDDDDDDTTGAPAGEDVCDDDASMTAGSNTDDCAADECDDADSMPADSNDEDECGAVLGLELTRGGTATAAGAADALPVVLAADVAAATTPAPSVLGTETSRGLLASVAAGSLAFTGDHLLVLFVAGLVTLLVGWVLVRQARRGTATTTA
jgi:hypothetical protein